MCVPSTDCKDTTRMTAMDTISVANNDKQPRTIVGRCWYIANVRASMIAIKYGRV